MATMLTFLPAEASQEEVANWPEPVVEHLGQRLGEAQRLGLAAAKAKGILIHPAAIAEVNGRYAVRFTVAFVGSDGHSYTAEKYFFYTSSRTIVLTFQWTSAAASGSMWVDRERILASLRIR
jgi:DNA invertase Pin-like site-specific DNA recombinase